MELNVKENNAYLPNMCVDPWKQACIMVGTTFQQQMTSHNKPHMEMVEQLWYLLMQVKGNDILKLNGAKAK
jgi:hypothetical protein